MKNTCERFGKACRKGLRGCGGYSGSRWCRGDVVDAGITEQCEAEAREGCKNTSKKTEKEVIDGRHEDREAEADESEQSSVDNSERDSQGITYGEVVGGFA